MAKSDGRVPSANEMVEAFIHPPTVLSIGVRRVEGSTVVVLASVELWPWRTVLRAVLADSAFEPSRVDFPTEPTASTVPGAVPGRVTAESQPARRRESLEWMMAFSLSDDVGTDYRCASWSGSGPPGTALWSDITWNFSSPVPARATQLVISGPVVGVHEVSITR